MTKFIADRIINHAHNRVIRYDDITDVIAKHMLRDERAVSTTVEYLKTVHKHFELLAPHVDDLKEQTRKEIQYELGRRFRLSTLRARCPKLYNRLKRFGQPSLTLKEWGFIVIVGDASISREKLRSRLWGLVNNKEDRRIIGLARRSPNTYQLVIRRAESEGMPIKEYIESLGFKYGKGE